MLQKYAWVNEIEACTVAVIEGRAAGEVVRPYGGDPGDSVGEYRFADLATLKGPGEPEPIRFHVQVFTVDSHVVALENDGYTGSIPEIARRCSEHFGRFFSGNWDINAFGMVTQAIAGRVVAFFEHLYPLALL